MTIPGTAVVQVAGFSPVLVVAGGVLSLLGYTRAGSTISFERFWEDVPCDSNGGDSGPPAEIQYMGEIARVRLLLTKWDESIAEAIIPAVNGASLGVPSAPGTLMFATGNTTRVCINSPTNPYNFSTCLLREPHEVNRGSKFSEWSLSFTAYENPTTGVLWDRTNT